MSGITSGIDYALLFNTGTSDTTSNLLNAIYGTSGSTSTVNALTALRTAEKNETQDVAVTAKEPQVARDIAAFKTAVATAKTPQQLLQNPTALKVLLTANGLGDQVSYTALAQKALMSDPNDPNSLANKLASTDSRWLSVVKIYNFATQGLTTLQNASVQDTIANGYAEVTWGNSLDSTTPGLSSAMTFLQEASTVTSADQILGDSVLRDVVTTAFGIPTQIAYQDFGAQELAINTHLDIGRLQSAQYVQSVAQQYLLAKQQAAQSSTTPSLDALAVQAAGLVV